MGSKGSKCESRVVMVGLDGAGKTTILNTLTKPGEEIKTTPTLGFNVEPLVQAGVHLSIWDVGGQDAIRGLWPHYFHNMRALVFVVDSTDRFRLKEAADELKNLLAMKELGQVALNEVKLLILANKQDLPNPLSSDEIIKAVGLNETQNIKWEIFKCTATIPNDPGLTEGFNWLSENLRQTKKEGKEKKEKKAKN